MYNKIASIILNSAKADGLSDVFVAQPDSLKENLAGKIFVLAEFSGKKSESRKIFDFLVLALSDNYYNDEKILFRGKIEGLKIENIFEAAITKTNKNLADFLASEKIKINPTATNITLGVIYENKLHFANFGRNRAILIYHHGEEYEIINVEANAEEVINNQEETTDEAGPKTPKLFSSVISGEVPSNSYFIFMSEALPEYLSSKDLISIVTKLPPIAAAEQIKNVLAKINTYVPFLGIIIKNTVGLVNAESKEEIEESSLAHSSISSLNYTEQKTEQMLAPAGLINFSKITKYLQELVGRWSTGAVRTGKKYLPVGDRATLKDVQPPLSSAADLGTVKSLNLARPDSFLIKEKIFFKKKSGWLSVGLKNFFIGLLDLFNPRRWSDFAARLRSWTAGLNKQNRWLFSALSLAVVIFVVSIIFTNWNQARQVEQTNFNNLVAAIDNQESTIDAHLLYNDAAGAKTALIAAQAALSSLPQKTAEQRAAYSRLANRLSLSEEKIEKIVKVGVATKVNDLSGLAVTNLTYAGGKIYAAGGATIYKITPGVAAYSKVTVAGAVNLNNSILATSNLLYYADGSQIIQYNPATGKSSSLKVTNLDPTASLNGFGIFYGNLYVLAKSKNQIYRYNSGAGGYKVKTDWLQGTTDLSLASSLFVDGDIYVLNNNGQVWKFFKGQMASFSSAPLTPVMTTASRLIVGQKYLYIFDAASKRLAVLSKSDGALVNQYVVDSLRQPQDFAVDETGKTAYFLDSEAIYKISLNQ